MPARPKIVAVNGSIRDGNTADVLRHVGAMAERRDVAFEVIDVRDLRMLGTGTCGDCNARTEVCAMQDDLPAAVRVLREADGVIFAAPVQGFAISGLMQTFIERAGVCHLRFERPLTNKVGGAIAIARRYSATESWTHLTAHLLLNRMILVGSGFPAAVHGLHPGEALHDEEGMTNVERMVDRMIDMIELLAEHRGLTGREPLPVPDANERVGIAFETVRGRG
ncbi:flavodoxin family protein [Actinocorallia sp. API 0066]|uniref:flavodoxin family protein n=1 Tax=Actinocorallia sp. API 0066 TaxID=2896846 RepID=UPI001E3E2028|nr:flavodoxin family protein [Actinocorallia sp. API 0066]MCD0447750.1 flavodoxin family protein [Actinocorallia sp. API 0066]